MDSGAKTAQESAIHTKKVRIETFGLVSGSAVLGAVAAVAVMRINGVETVSTISLLGFFLMIGLSVSAIVLAVVAIMFSRTAERTITRKSEEMNALQSEMTTQTSKAAGRVEAMGKEIAGTIHNNFETLAAKIQENLPSRDVLRADVAEAVERSQFSETSIQDVSVSDPLPKQTVRSAVVSVPESVTQEMRETADRKYGEFKDIVLLGVANYPGVIARKIGEGQYRTEGDELVDGAFIVQNEKVAVCTFCAGEIITERFLGEKGESFSGFLRSLCNEIKSGHFTRVFLVFDGKLTDTSPYAHALNQLSSRIDSETFACFELFEGSPDIIIPELTERVSQLMEMPDREVPELSFRRPMGA